MRVVLLLLVAANLLAFAWGQGWLTPIIGDVRQPERMGRQVGPDRLRVLGPGDSARTERAVAGRIESDESSRPPHPPAGSPRRQAAEPAASTPRDAEGDGPRAMLPGSASPPGAPSTTTARQELADSRPAAMAVAPTSPPAPAAAPNGPSPSAASAPPTSTAPAVPFGLAEPPLTEALASENGRQALAPRAAAPQPQPSALSAPSAQPPLADASRAPLVPGTEPAPPATGLQATQACFDLRGLDSVRAEAARTDLQGMGAVDIEDLAAENRSGYIIYLPPAESVELAQARIEQLREQGLRDGDFYLILDGTYRLAISLGVFNRMDSVELQLERLRARGVEGAEVGFVNPGATRITLRVRGPGDLLDEAQLRAMANLRGGSLVRCQ